MLFCLNNEQHLPQTPKTMNRRKENLINLNVDPSWPSHQVRLYRRFILEAYCTPIPRHVAMQSDVEGEADEEIARRLRDGESYRSISKDLGVSNRIIMRVRKRMQSNDDE